MKNLIHPKLFSTKNYGNIKYAAAILPIIFCLFASTFAQQETLKLSTQDEIKNEIALVPCKNKERLEGVKSLFRQMGASDSDITVEDLKGVRNVVITKKGKTNETVIVGAHYDKVSDGCGAIDNWTGVVIIANLYKTLRTTETDKTYIFVAFDKEEIGLIGSNALAKTITKEQKSNTCSMVNLDSFGFGYPQILDNTSNSKMTNFAANLAKELEMPFSHASLAGAADADSTSFNEKDIPAVTFHGLSAKWQNYLHSNNDKVENINVSSVFVGYNFLLRFLGKLDAESCNSFKK